MKTLKEHIESILEYSKDNVVKLYSENMPNKIKEKCDAIFNITYKNPVCDFTGVDIDLENNDLKIKADSTVKEPKIFGLNIPKNTVSELKIEFKKHFLIERTTINVNRIVVECEKQWDSASDCDSLSVSCGSLVILNYDMFKKIFDGINENAIKSLDDILTMLKLHSSFVFDMLVVESQETLRMRRNKFIVYDSAHIDLSTKYKFNKKLKGSTSEWYITYD